MTSEHATVCMTRVDRNIRRLLQFDVFITEDGNLVVDSAMHR